MGDVHSYGVLPATSLDAFMYPYMDSVLSKRKGRVNTKNIMHENCL